MSAVDYAADVIAFLIVIFVLYRYIWRGGLNLSGAMTARQNAIAAEIEESKANHERLVVAEGSYRDAIAEARAESTRIAAESAAEGEEIVAELKVKAEEEYRRMTALNEGRLAAERQSVVSALRQEVGQRTLRLAEEMVVKTLDAAAQRRVIDRFIANLDARDASNSTDGPAAAAVPTSAGRAG